jgi:hypothetical protein
LVTSLLLLRFSPRVNRRQKREERNSPINCAVSSKSGNAVVKEVSSAKWERASDKRS